MSTSDKSEWSVVGLAHKFGLAWERVGGTLADINGLAENLPLLMSFIGVLRGTHEIKTKAFPLWRSVVLGRHQTPDAYIASIEGRGRKANRWAREIAAKVVCAQQETELPLVDVLDTDLGLTSVYTTREFYQRAATFGLYPCPAEAGLALADQFDDQPKGDYRRVAMEAIADSDGRLNVFCVYRGGDGLRLGANDGHPGGPWTPGHRWVLTTRKP